MSKIGKNKFLIFFVKGKSMWPLLKDGDFVLCKKTKDIKIFDIVAVKNKNKTIIHRFFLMRKNKLLLHGDNNASFLKANAAFESYEIEKLVGKVVGFIRKNKTYYGFLFFILSTISLIYSLIKSIPFLIKKFLLNIKMIFKNIFFL